ncbi:MAG TPA: PEP/pyruvate-binding domain-containing protein, partial [Desulfobaccales bacterium]|nr:PEP/pyruvate-binding domain-containing protein [Desulfobaccales bacterium]
ITTRAFYLFLTHNELRHRLDELLAEVHLDDWCRLEELSREMVAMVKEGEVPVELQEDIHLRLAELERQGNVDSFSLRSSAVREDGDISFAGQYDSLLQVSKEDFLTAYREVLASKYTPRAVAYRIRRGLADQESPMAVLVMEMIEARLGGVVYTRDREAAGQAADFLAVYAVPGPGHQLVDGRAEPEVHYFTRETHPRFVKRISGYTYPDPEPPDQSYLSLETATMLADWGLRLEELAGCPQDIEWCQDSLGTCYILQARPLLIGDDFFEPWHEPWEAPPVAHPVLLDGGMSANPGVGTGPVYIIKSEAELAEVPDGSVLIAPTLSPSLAGVIERLRAVVAESGSRACHFASIAREFGVPVLAAVHDAA